MAYKYLDYDECMELIGVFDSERRVDLYKEIERNICQKILKNILKITWILSTEE